MTEIVDAPTRPAGLNYVGGAWVPAASGETYTKVNPMHPSETVGEFSSSTEADADAAVAAADAAFAGWAALPMARRGAYLNAAAAVLEARTEHVARDMSTEMGKPLREARGEAGRAAQILRYAASEAFRSVGEHFEQAATGAQVSTRRRPVGVVALITPWNFPMAIPIWKLAPALAVPDDWKAPVAIRLRIVGADGSEIFSGQTFTTRMKRSPGELADWVVRDNPLPPGSILLTGTGLVPPDDYTLEPGHTVEIEIDGIGVLRNTVAG